MLNVALTGNVAAGKSSVLAHFTAWGATVIDADDLVREAQAPGGPLLVRIVERFGQDLLRSNGSLDRDRLRGIIIRDEQARLALNALVHPEVGRRRDQAMDDARRRGDLLVVSDIPLLFEVLDPSEFDTIVLVDAPVELRRRRLLHDRHLDPGEADRLIATQLGSDLKRSRSHFVIENDGTREALEASAWNVWKDLRRRAARASTVGDGSLPFVAPTLRALLDGPVGTLARYVDAGFAADVVLGETPNPDFAAGVADVLPLRLLTTGRLDADALERTARSDGHRAVVATGDVGRIGAGWIFAGGDADAPVRLDVRPWRDVSHRAREAAALPRAQPHEREGFRPAEGSSAEPRFDLFSPG